MHDLAILTCRYGGAAFVLWAFACAILGSLQPISVLRSRQYTSARERRGARRALIIVACICIVVASLGAVLIGVSFNA